MVQKMGGPILRQVQSTAASAVGAVTSWLGKHVTWPLLRDSKMGQVAATIYGRARGAFEAAKGGAEKVKEEVGTKLAELKSRLPDVSPQTLEWSIEEKGRLGKSLVRGADFAKGKWGEAKQFAEAGLGRAAGVAEQVPGGVRNVAGAVSRKVGEARDFYGTWLNAVLVKHAEERLESLRTKIQFKYDGLNRLKLVPESLAKEYRAWFDKTRTAENPQEMITAGENLLASLQRAEIVQKTTNKPNTAV